jgi:hypothetical protein
VPDSESDPTPPPAIGADVAERLIAALERIARGPAYDGRGTPQPDPVRARIARDFDVLRGLLGQPGTPRPLRMHRESEAVFVDDTLPPESRAAVVESPGDGSSGFVSERIDLRRRLQDVVELPLKKITDPMPISRVEIFDAEGALLAFGPSLAPIPSVLELRS